MSISSKIALSLVLAGLSVPAFAAPVSTDTKAPAITHGTMVRKVATPATVAPDATKTDAAKVGTPAKPAIAKTETVKPAVNTGLSKPAVPATTVTPAPTTPVVKSN